MGRLAEHSRWGKLRVPAHRASSATLAGAYPFLAPAPCQVGVPIGTDAITGEPFCFDPWSLYAAGRLTNPNVALAGVIGAGKSALAKSLAVRAVAAGRRAYVPGDPKGEWAPVAEALGGVVLRLGPGLPARLNPLDAGASPEGRSGGARVLAAITETLLDRPLRPGERVALDVAVHSAECAGPAQVGTVAAALTDPDPAYALADGTPPADRIADGTELVHALRRLLRGDLAGMFDGPSSVTLDPAAPMVVVDLSALGSDDTAVAVAMTCASAWLESALTTHRTAHRTGPDTAGGRWVIYDEAWRLLRSPALLRRMQAQWKLSRAHGIANLLVLHRLSDLDAVGAGGSETRALAAGLLADCSTRVIYRQESDQLAGIEAALGLTDTERALLPVLPRGCGLWKLPGSSYVAKHRLHAAEAAVYDTDMAMRVTGGGLS
ncbi:MAG: ATP-binding protein [Sporichthya sp.]|nr:ATP-binding protein [Sporichthya sp.]